jgi:hypothetical protein
VHSPVIPESLRALKQNRCIIRRDALRIPAAAILKSKTVPASDSAIATGVHRLEDAFVSRLKLLQCEFPVSVPVHQTKNYSCHHGTNHPNATNRVAADGLFTNFEPSGFSK